MAQQAIDENLRREAVAAETANQMAKVQTRVVGRDGRCQGGTEFWDRMSRDLVKQGRNLRSEIRRFIGSLLRPWASWIGRVRLATTTQHSS